MVSELLHILTDSDKTYIWSPRATTKKWLRKSEKLTELKCYTRKYSLNTKESRKGGTEGEKDM